MKASIEVKSREEAKHITRAMEDPTTRALVVVIGALLALRTSGDRRRVMQWVTDRLAEDNSTETTDANRP